LQDVGALANENNGKESAEGGGEIDSDEIKRMRRKKEKKQRKLNKRKNNDVSIVMCSQNYNGSSSREKLEETSREMRAQKIGIVFGQEGRRPAAQIQRRDTDEAFITFGGGDTTNDNDNRKEDGNFFVLDNKWRELFAREGKQKRRCYPRLVTIRMPLHHNKSLYLVNVHWPDQGKSAAIRSAYQKRFEQALQDKHINDVMIVMGDFNASTGASAGVGDLVCGAHGISYQDEQGRQLKATAATCNVIDLVTWEEQKMEATCCGIATRAGRQLDRCFIARERKTLVKKCVNAEIIVDSDHESLRLRMVIGKAERAKKTVRKVRAGKAVDNAFGHEANEEMKSTAVLEIANRHEDSTRTSSQMHKQVGDVLMEIVGRAIDHLGKREAITSGWSDENYWELTLATRARNWASSRCAKSKNEVDLEWFKETKKQVKCAASTAQNN
jgi:endonuclease/exonuclease/phosphatase family metal-dependent hydrolase